MLLPLSRVYLNSNLSVTHRPIRVTVDGHQQYSGLDGSPASTADPSSLTPRAFTTILDIFHYNLEAQEQKDSMFDVSTICSNYQDLINGGGKGEPTASLNSGEVAGAIVALLILIIIIGILAWWAFGRGRNGRSVRSNAAGGAGGAAHDDDEHHLASDEQPSSDRGRVAMSEVHGNVKAQRLHDMDDDAEDLDGVELSER